MIAFKSKFVGAERIWGVSKGKNYGLTIAPATNLPHSANREEMSLTEAQQAACRARGDVLVVAGAGTGKTRTLVERCLACLLEEHPRVSLEQLLLVTFTEAAAAEMRQRVRAGLEEQAALQPEARHWTEQLALFETAQIGTLHA